MLKPPLIQLALLRRVVGLSQAQLAKKIGIVQQRVSLLEQGLPPSNDEMISRIAKALNVDEWALSAVELDIHIKQSEGSDWYRVSDPNESVELVPLDIAKLDRDYLASP